MKKIPYILSVFSFCLPLSGFAFFCPTNFNQINMGDSIETVTTVCGKPDAQEERDEKPTNPQEWSYYLTQATPTTFPSVPTPTQKTTFAFDDKGILVNITVGGLGTGSTSLCGPLVQLGDNIERVTAACGKPSFVQSQDASLNEQPSIRVTEFTYMKANPPTKLIFRNGALTEKTP